MRKPLALLLLALAAACSRAARKDVTPPLAPQVAQAAAERAAELDPAAGPALTPGEQIDHLLGRVTFGPRPQDRERVARQGIAAFLEDQLHPERLDDGPLEARLAPYDVLRRGSSALVQELIAGRKANQEQKKAEDESKAKAAAEPAKGNAKAAMPDAEMAAQDRLPPDTDAESARRPRDLRKQLGRAGRGPGFDFVVQLSEAKLLRALSSERQLQEVMADFWFNHFNVFAGKEDEAGLLPDYEERVLRPNALSSFPELLEATAHSPAMLVYLDNWRSASPTEPPRPGRRKFAAPDVPKPQQRRGLNENYARELLELHTLGVDGGYTQQDIIEVARCFTGWTVEAPATDPRFFFKRQMHDFGKKTVLGHVIPAGRGVEDGEAVLRILEEHPATARFLAGKLARRFVSDDPPDALVDRVAATYTRTHGDLRSMLRTLFESPEFWSRRTLKAKVRSPLELVASSVRALGASVDEPGVLLRTLARIGEPLYAAQPPTGYGDTAQAWLSSGALLARIDFGLELVSGMKGVKLDLSPLSAGTKTPEDVLDRTAKRLGAHPLSEKTHDYVLAQLRAASPKPELQAARAVGLLLGAPELQRR